MPTPLDRLGNCVKRGQAPGEPTTTASPGSAGGLYGNSNDNSRHSCPGRLR
jgi:hypothetical protein